MITTHVLDTARGRPAAGVPVTLEQQTASGDWQLIGRAETGSDGRLPSLTPDRAPFVPGTYRLIFDTKRYLEAHGSRVFFPSITIVFVAAAGEMHYHVPLLLSPFGYSTYRGS